MDKQQFLDSYVNRPNKIRMIFNRDSFLQNSTIQIRQDRVGLSDVLDYYVPKFKVGGRFDGRGIGAQIDDRATLPLTMREAALDPAEWGLSKDDGPLQPDIGLLEPVPIATDLKSGQTLMLDSNHTIANILHERGRSLDKHTTLQVVRLVGSDLEDVVADFKIINRVTKQ